MHHRPSLAIAAFVLSVGTAEIARADDKKVCIAAAEQGQELRNANKIRDARAQFALCARPVCPKAVADECSRWEAQAEAALASVKLEAVDEKGAPVAPVKVLVDGSPWADELPSTSVLLDPGSHEIRFEREGSAPVVRSVSLAMGEKERVVRATFKDEGTTGAETVLAAPAPAPERPRTGGSLVLPIAFGSAGAVALGTAGAFWLMGNSEADDVRARCQNGCPDSEMDGAKQKHLIGDIALGVGLVAIAAAAYFFITRDTAPKPVVRF